MEVLNQILEVLNAWADADREKIRVIHADLMAQVLPRLPLVLPPRERPPRKYGPGQRAMRKLSDPHPEGWGHAEK